MKSQSKIIKIFVPQVQKFNKITMLHSQIINREVVLQKQKESLEQIVKRRFIYQPGFALYGGFAGLYDYGPVGCAIKNNVEQYWREHFIIEEDMLEISTTCITPEPILKASGHVDRFADLLVTDSKTKQGYRADKLVSEILENKLAKEKLSEVDIQGIRKILSELDGYKMIEMKAVISKFKIMAPETGNELTDPEPFNLMLATSLGPSTKVSSFLRPETAQGIFLNFNRLLEQNCQRLPFGGAQIGLGFRNEIAPRNQLMRCREFQMAEIEYFIDPLDKKHPKFKNYLNFNLPLFSKQNQIDLQNHALVDVTQAVERGIIDNETLAYFLCRTYEFLVNIGINEQQIRFRQHLADEMAHYSSDCWDAEIETSFGWIECVGIADRSAFDLNAHSKATGQKLVAPRRFKVPQQRDIINVILDKPNIGKTMKKDGTLLINHIEALTDLEKEHLSIYLETNETKSFQLDGKECKLQKTQIKFEKKSIFVVEEKFTPNVIEPSFGIGRIIQALLEHSFRQRDALRSYFKFPPKIAPQKCSVLPVVSNDEFIRISNDLTSKLKKVGISCKSDNSGVTLGKKYARTDEIGIPFAFTVDSQTLIDQTVTLREIESTKQVRILIGEGVRVMNELSNNLITWEEVLGKYPLFETKIEDEEEQKNQ